MLRCSRNRKNIRKKSLTRHAYKKRICGGVSLCTGSYTLEAAVVIPLVTGFWMFLLFFFRVLEVETSVYGALSYSGRKAAAVAGTWDNPAASLASAEVYFRQALSEYEVIERYVAGGSLGISLLTSDCAGEYVDLKAYYRIKFPIGFFPVKGITVFQESKSRKWMGKPVGEEEEQRYVYVTEYGKAYHRSRECHYLDLSVKSVKMAQIEGLRNLDAHKYYPCELCAEEIQTIGEVYITDYGESYHATLACSGLKRTVYTVELSKVGARHPCGKCAVGENLGTKESAGEGENQEMEESAGEEETRGMEESAGEKGNPG